MHGAENIKLGQTRVDFILALYKISEGGIASTVMGKWGWDVRNQYLL